MNMISTTLTTVSANPLASRAMLASLSIKTWTARKLDKKVTQEANDANGAAADAGRFNKSLIARNAFAAITTAANAARAYHDGQTLPWTAAGARIMPAAIYLDYAAKMKEHRAAFETAVAEFVDNYPAYVDHARAALGQMFSQDDYPDVAKVRGAFDFGVRIMPCGNPDFRVGLSPAQIAEITADVEASTRAAVDAAMADVKVRITETVGRMAERLRAFEPGKDGAKAKGIFRDTLVENVRELAKVLPAFNLSDSPVLASLASRIETELCAADAETLRESSAARDSVATAAEKILADVSAYMS